MFRIRLADTVVELDNRYGLVEQVCHDYLVPQTEAYTPAFRVSVTNKDLCTYTDTCGRPMTEPEAESLLLYRRICEHMPRFDTILLHAAVVEMDGRGYAFSAARGVGKTTHTSLWQSHFAGRATVINGDKPLIRRSSDGHLWVYGTPWCGKEGKQENRRCPLTAICFLEQDTENRIEPTPIGDAVSHLLMATVLPPQSDEQSRMAALIGRIARDVPMYTLACRPDISAAEMAYEFLSQV